jgi:hypothetical protein
LTFEDGLTRRKIYKNGEDEQGERLFNMWKDRSTCGRLIDKRKDLLTCGKID